MIGAGTCTIDANQAGNGSYLAAPQVQQSFAVGLAPQTISFTSTPPGGADVGGPAYTVSGTASSGLAVTFTIAAEARLSARISGSTVSFIGAGTCTINANQAGNGTYQAAPQVQQSVTVTSPPPPASTQSITFTSTPPAAAAVGGAGYTVSASASSGLPVTFSIDASSAGVCTISGSVVSFVGTGTCTIDANQAGNGSYLAAPQAQQSFAVGLASQAISFTSSPPGGATVGGADLHRLGERELGSRRDLLDRRPRAPASAPSRARSSRSPARAPAPSARTRPATGAIRRRRRHSSRSRSPIPRRPRACRRSPSRRRRRPEPSSADRRTP